MAIPKDPRQQMINLMYLFLTAMLALNVSKQVLNAFVLVNEGIGATIGAIETKNSQSFSQFEHQMEVNKKETEPLYDDAQKAKQIADELFKYIGDLKEEIVKKSGGRNEKGEVISKKNLDIPSMVMLNAGKGDKLKEKINDTRNQLLEIIKSHSEPAAKRYEKQLSLKEAKAPEDDPQNRSWAEFNFQMVPTIASVTLLTKYQNDVRSAEADVVNFLLNQIGAGKFKVDVLRAKVIENTNYVMAGQEYKADIFVSAYSSSQKPKVFIGKLDTNIAQKDTAGENFKKITQDKLNEYSKNAQLATYDEGGEELKAPLKSIDTILPPQRGMGRYVKKPHGVGLQKYEGAIRVQKPGGAYEWYPFQEDYQVAKGGVVVSPEKMNVLYIGVDNPLAISVPGFKSEDVQPRLVGVNGRLASRGEGRYFAKINNARPGDGKVSVSVKLPSGKTKHMGEKKFRIKRVPDPVAAVGQFKGGKVPTAEFTAQQGIIAKLENFVYDLRFKVTGFSMTYIPKNGDALIVDTKGALFNDRMKNFLNRAKPGDRFFFDQIEVRGPSGETRTLPSISFELQ